MFWNNLHKIACYSFGKFDFLFYEFSFFRNFMKIKYADSYTLFNYVKSEKINFQKYWGKFSNTHRSSVC